MSVIAILRHLETPSGLNCVAAEGLIAYI